MLASAWCFASRSVTCTSPNSVVMLATYGKTKHMIIPLCRFANLSSYDSTSVSEIVLSAPEACEFGFQSIGQRTPCFATAWKASKRRSASKTLRPTVKLLSVIYLPGQQQHCSRIDVKADLLDKALIIDDEHATQTDTFLFYQDTIVFANLVGRITE